MIMDLLYHGRIYPQETIMSEEEGFQEAEAKVNELFDDLRSRLNDKDKEQLDEIRDTMYTSQCYEEEENFRYGLTLGVLLMQEIYEVYEPRYFREQIEEDDEP
ncbi:MAG: hypothetical protein LUH20_06835 [Lachnospiraceae bacterium]|nr:hypothetical protein [Lachnospiraceae bacterium]